jgi:hypothetical protein
MPDPSDERTRRLSLRIDKDLKRRVDTDAERRGQSLRVYVERALEATLSGQGSGDTSSVSSPRGSGSVKETAPTESSASPPTPGRAKQAGSDAGTPLPKIAQRRRDW